MLFYRFLYIEDLYVYLEKKDIIISLFSFDFFLSTFI